MARKRRRSHRRSAGKTKCILIRSGHGRKKVRRKVRVLASGKYRFMAGKCR